MQSRKLSLAVGVVLLIGIFLMTNPNAAYSTTSTSCEASLDGSGVVPPVETDGTGSANMEFDPSTNELTWSIEFSELSGPAIQAHFHGPANDNSTAGVQVNIGEDSDLVSPIEGSAELSPEQASWLQDGQLYINIHTDENPDGEIRGQVLCDSAPVQIPDEGSSQIATVAAGDQEFDVPYEMTGDGTLDQLTADPETQTLLASITVASAGNLTIWLPNELVSVEDDEEFAVFIDDEFGNFVVDELEPTENARVLRIELVTGAEEVEIVGTSMFGAEEEEEPSPEEQENLSVEIDGQTYEIPYEVTGGSVEQVTADLDSKSMMFMISSDTGGVLTLWLPTEVIDAEEDFSVFVGGDLANFTELGPTGKARVLEIEFEGGSEEIEVMGTSIVPEFGSIAILVASIVTMGVAIATRRFLKFGGIGT